MIVLDLPRHAPTPAATPPAAAGPVPSLLGRLGPAERADLADYGRWRTLSSGETLSLDGAAAFLSKGAVAAMIDLERGEQIGAALYVAGDAPGLMEAGAGAGLEERLTAVVQSEALVVPAPAVRRLWRDEPAFREALVAHWAAAAACARRWTACQIRHGAEGRVAALLVRLLAADGGGGRTLTLTQETCAAVLGLQRTTVSQAAGALQLSGAVRWRRGAVDVLDADRLSRHACECPAVETSIRRAV